jgi:hypothetical protein
VYPVVFVVLNKPLVLLHQRLQLHLKLQALLVVVLPLVGLVAVVVLAQPEPIKLIK